MFRCEACGEDMSEVLSQCPSCSSWQVGAVALRRNSPIPRRAVQTSSRRGKASSPQPLTEEQEWARATLASLGFLWGSDIDFKLEPVIIQKSNELTPKTRARSWWHGLSTALIVLAFVVVGMEDLEATGASVLFIWLASVSFHGWVALKGYSSRDSAKSEKQQELWRVVRGELANERRKLLKNGPFGPSQAPPPSRKSSGVDDVEAEHLCARWLAHLGEETVEVTRAKSDGGIDIVSARCVAQVKNYKGSVGVVPIRELVGVASVDGRFPVFFTSGNFTKAAVDFSDAANVYLFRYDAEAGTLDAGNSIARNALP